MGKLCQERCNKRFRFKQLEPFTEGFLPGFRAVITKGTTDYVGIQIFPSTYIKLNTNHHQENPAQELDYFYLNHINKRFKNLHYIFVQFGR